MLQLHVLGPAFQLASIDAECNAATALLRATSNEHGLEWALVPSNSEKRVPCLVDESRHILGFENIARYVEQHYTTALHQLSEQQRADSIALSSFLDTQASTLLAIHLYVSFENYRHATRPAFSVILPWYANYILPPRLRSAARAKTEHLGVSSIDVDNVHEDTIAKPGQEFSVKEEDGIDKAAQKRASLLLPRKDTVRSLLQRPEHAAMFRLHRLAEDFFAPLQAMLGHKKFLLGTEAPSSVDFLAYGYMCLMLKPEVPQDWLPKVMRQKYKNLVEFTERMHNSLRMSTRAEDVVALAPSKHPEGHAATGNVSTTYLPWTAPPMPSATDVVASIGSDLLARIPMLGNGSEVVPLEPFSDQLWRVYLPAILATATASLTLGGWLAFSSGWLVWPHGERVHSFGRKRLSDYGHLGAALSGITLVGQQAPRSSGSAANEPNMTHPNVVDVEHIEMDG